jgi:PAS domain S-box-containing protein
MNKEQFMRENDFIVSKTDKTGKITYCNRTFMDFAKYEEAELLNQQHNIIRHPDMPRCIFKLMWDTIQMGKEINCYVKNLAQDGSYYWVHANVTPEFDSSGKIKGYYSVRRKPNKERLDKIKVIYQQLLSEERKNSLADGMKKSELLLNNLLKAENKTYEEFIFTI